MAQSFQFDLVSPERLLVSEQALSVILPGAEGEMTVMANHAPVMTTVSPGIVTVAAASGQESRYVVYGGFADILPEGCTLLAESAVPIAEARREDIETRIEAARAELDQATDDPSRTRLEYLLNQLATLRDAV